MKERLASMLCVIMMLACMLLLPARNVQAADDVQMLEGSYLSDATESLGLFDPGMTIGEDLLAGYSKCVVLGPGKIYAGGTTIAAHEVSNIQVIVIVERAQEEDTEWTPYDMWKQENEDSDRANSNRMLEVEGGYYYRVRCIHIAGTDGSSSFTNGVYVEEP